MNALLEALATTSPLELAANLVTTVSILLAGRNSVYTWWTGIAGGLLFAWLFLIAKLYADVALQLFFIATSAAGWWQWLRGAQGAPLPVSRAAPRTLAWCGVGGLAATAAYGALLFRFTDAYAPFVDSAVLAFSVIAQFLLMRRKLETWLFWLLVNSIAIPLYASRHLHLTALLYVGYWINAVVAWFWWRKLWRAEGTEPAGKTTVAVAAG